MLLSALKGLMSAVFPLISFPYISRVLGVENLGKYNFASTFVLYFVLVANLGITPYAIRECAIVRNEREKVDELASDIFTINVVSAFSAVIVMLFILFGTEKLQPYRLTIIILALQIPLNLIGVEWLFSAFEDYYYITIRSVAVQFLSIVMLFCFVRSENSLVTYSIITVISSAGASVLNWYNAKKYCNIRLKKVYRLKKHLKSIFILFAMTVAGTIYSSTDITILGVICGDTSVGLYSVSTKIYLVVKTVISSIVLVSIPRLSSIVGTKDDKNFSETAGEIYSILLTFAIPAMIGLILLRKNIVAILAGLEYTQAQSSLLILAVSLLFALGSYFWGQSVLIPLGKEKYVFCVTAIFALLNFALNIILIPRYHENAAAFTTLLAEAGSFAMFKLKAHQYMAKSSEHHNLGKIIVGTVWIIICNYSFLRIFGNSIIYICGTIITSVVGYFLIEYFLKNEVVSDAISKIKFKN